jgi:predicted MFS family arabinose efflux permease
MSAVLLAVPLLGAAGILSLLAVAIVLFVFGTFSLLNDTASQSYLPSLVGRPSLLGANARLDQSATVAQTSGPVIGGALVTWLSAPFALLVNAVAYAAAGILVSRIKLEEARQPHTLSVRNVLSEIQEGLKWLYRHPTLAPLAISTHIWFIANSLLLTVFVPFALRYVGLTPLEYGITLGLAGVGGLIGATLAPRIGNRIGAGSAVLAGRILVPLAWVGIVFAPTTAAAGPVIAVLVVGGAQAVYGFGMGIETANEMGYKQAITPDELQGRSNATMRSANRTMLVVGALAGGFLADWIGYVPTIWIGVAVFAIAALVIAFSPFRTAEHPTPQTSPEP